MGDPRGDYDLSGAFPSLLSPPEAAGEWLPAPECSSGEWLPAPERSSGEWRGHRSPAAFAPNDGGARLASLSPASRSPSPAPARPEGDARAARSRSPGPEPSPGRGGAKAAEAATEARGRDGGAPMPPAADARPAAQGYAYAFVGQVAAFGTARGGFAPSALAPAAFPDGPSALAPAAFPDGPSALAPAAFPDGPSALALPPRACSPQPSAFAQSRASSSSMPRESSPRFDGYVPAGVPSPPGSFPGGSPPQQQMQRQVQREQQHHRQQQQQQMSPPLSLLLPARHAAPVSHSDSPSQQPPQRAPQQARPSSRGGGLASPFVVPPNHRPDGAQAVYRLPLVPLGGQFPPSPHAPPGLLPGTPPDAGAARPGSPRGPAAPLYPAPYGPAPPGALAPLPCFAPHLHDVRGAPPLAPQQALRPVLVPQGACAFGSPTDGTREPGPAYQALPPHYAQGSPSYAQGSPAFAPPPGQSSPRCAPPAPGQGSPHYAPLAPGQGSPHCAPPAPGQGSPHCAPPAPGQSSPHCAPPAPGQSQGSSRCGAGVPVAFTGSPQCASGVPAAFPGSPGAAHLPSGVPFSASSPRGAAGAPLQPAHGQFAPAGRGAGSPSGAAQSPLAHAPPFLASPDGSQPLGSAAGSGSTHAPSSSQGLVVGVGGMQLASGGSSRLGTPTNGMTPSHSGATAGAPCGYGAPLFEQAAQGLAPTLPDPHAASRASTSPGTSQGGCPLPLPADGGRPPHSGSAPTFSDPVHLLPPSGSFSEAAGAAASQAADFGASLACDRGGSVVVCGSFTTLCRSLGSGAAREPSAAGRADPGPPGGAHLVPMAGDGVDDLCLVRRASHSITFPIGRAPARAQAGWTHAVHFPGSDARQQGKLGQGQMQQPMHAQHPQMLMQQRQHLSHVPVPASRSDSLPPQPQLYPAAPHHPRSPHAQAAHPPYAAPQGGYALGPAAPPPAPGSRPGSSGGSSAPAAPADARPPPQRPGAAARADAARAADASAPPSARGRGGASARGSPAASGSAPVSPRSRRQDRRASGPPASGGVAKRAHAGSVHRAPEASEAGPAADSARCSTQVADALGVSVVEVRAAQDPVRGGGAFPVDPREAPASPRGGRPRAARRHRRTASAPLEGLAGKAAAVSKVGGTASGSCGAAPGASGPCGAAPGASGPCGAAPGASGPCGAAPGASGPCGAAPGASGSASAAAPAPASEGPPSASTPCLGVDAAARGAAAPAKSSSSSDPSAAATQHDDRGDPSTWTTVPHASYLTPAHLRRGKGGRQPAADPRQDPTIDPKRARRILANRLSAAKSKLKQKLAAEELRAKLESLKRQRDQLVASVAAEMVARDAAKAQCDAA